ncbi:MAG: kinase [Moraxellaceae bacterium]|jgi:predicted polyphosphate/ATP-dependent NAD kinase|nr:kinase [Moraxellaceae bacterium]
MRQLSEGSEDAVFRLGFLVNPHAGLGGALALKGSDGMAAAALARGAVPQAGSRARLALQELLPWRERLLVLAAGGGMGAELAQELGFAVEIVHRPDGPSTAADTEAAARALVERRVDLLLFAGGDGTARDIERSVGLALAVLGIPAGVKMHSGVFAVNPRGAAEIVKLMLEGGLVVVDAADVRDIDEAALREGRVAARYYGELRVPQEGRYLQQVKCNGREVEALVLQEIAAEVTEHMATGVTYFLGPGTTVAAVMDELGLPNTLLGVDVVQDGELLAADADAATLEAFAAAGACRLILTATGGQGMLLGRGNQQLSPAVLRAVGRDGLIVIATNEKLKALAGRPLLMDLPDEALAQEFAGFIEVVTGYRNRILYRLATQA